MIDNSIEGVELTRVHVEFFQQAGASEAFLELIRAVPEDHNSDDNLVRREAREAVFNDELDGNPEDYIHRGGRLSSDLWDGDLYEAYLQADIGNAPLFESVFGEDRINADRPHSDSPLVSELNFDRFLIGGGYKSEDRFELE